MARAAAHAVALSFAVSLAEAGTVRILASARHDPDLTRALGVRRADVALIEARAEPGALLHVGVPINGVAATLALEPVSQRAPGFRLRAQRADGTWIDTDPGPVRTYEGMCPEIPGSRAAVFFKDGALTARVEVPGLPGAFWVEPAPPGLGGVDRGAEHPGILHVGYHSLDRVTPAGGPRDAAACHAGDSRPSTQPSPRPGERSTCHAAVCVAELACDSDFEFFQRHGSVEAAQAEIERVVAVTNLQFAAEVGIRHRIGTILVRTTPGPPYTSFQATTLLQQMQAHWNLAQGGVARDVALLFTGKTLSAGVFGSAFTGSICNTALAYALVRPDCCGSLAGATDITAHELGHVWGAHHCACAPPNPASTMNATITFANSFVTDISGASVASILAGRAAAPCLEADTPTPPPGPFALLSPPNETPGLTGPVEVAWTASANAAFYVLTVADNPGLTSPVLSSATLTTGGTVPASVLLPGTRYYWHVEAWNRASAATPASPGPWTFLTAAPPPACPGDFFPDNAVNTVDLTFLLGRFGQLVPPGQHGDMNGDGRVNTLDLTAFLGRFGASCP